MSAREGVEARLRSWPDAVLSAVLLAIAVLLALLALWPEHAVLKAVVLAWVLLP